MKTRAALFVGMMSLAAAPIVLADDDNGSHRVKITLTGYEETPATLSTTGNGRFSAHIRSTEVEWELSYADLEGSVTQAHIHFGARGMTGPIVVFLCTNLGNGPAGTQACPPSPATISGTFDSGDVLGGAAAQGLEAGNFDELVRAIRAGAAYVNVHSTLRPGGEIRNQTHTHSD